MKRRKKFRHTKTERAAMRREWKALRKKRLFYVRLARRILRVKPRTSAQRVRYQDTIHAANRRGHLSNKQTQVLLDLMNGLQLGPSLE